MDARTLPAVAHEVAPWIEVLARIGFVAKGALYMTVGGLAASAALGLGGKRDPDSHSALQRLFEVPYGRLLVGVVAVGLVGYAVWRIVEGVADPQRRGRGVKALAIRASYIVRGGIHLALAGAAFALALYEANGESHGNKIEALARRTLELPAGTIVLGAVGLGLVGYGLYQLHRAWHAKLSKQLRLRRAHGFIIGVSRLGIAARGVVFCTIGWLVSRAARDHDPRQAGGVGDSLRELFALGTWPFLAIALGLAAYGVYELINAKYRRIDVI